MKIIIDGRMLYWTGVGRYIQALLAELQAIDSVNSYVVLMRRADWALWAPTAANFSRQECNINPYTLAEQFKLPAVIYGLKPDLVHFTAPNTPLLYLGKRVVNIHDLTLLDYDTSRGHGFAKWLRGLKRGPFKFVLGANVRSATQLITVTRYVRDQIMKRFGIDGDRITTTLLAAEPATASIGSTNRFGDLGTYLFYVGNVYPYKNVASSLHALKDISTNYPDLKFVAAGKRDTFTVELEALAQELGLAERVKFVGFVNDAEKLALYRGAAGYLNPSLSEGFGLQGLEAMAEGTPVIAARASCLPEVYGEAAEYFDPHDSADQARAIDAVLGDAARAKALRAAGTERLKQFSWRRMAEETLVAYTSVSKNRP